MKIRATKKTTEVMRLCQNFEKQESTKNKSRLHIHCHQTEDSDLSLYVVLGDLQKRNALKKLTKIENNENMKNFDDFTRPRLAFSM